MNSLWDCCNGYMAGRSYRPIHLYMQINLHQTIYYFNFGAINQHIQAMDYIKFTARSAASIPATSLRRQCCGRLPVG